MGRQDHQELQRISIHALREEGDTSIPCRRVQSKNFYPRPPRGGRLPQSPCYPRRDDFYPRPPRGGRLSLVRKLVKGAEFLSTPSARRATCSPVRPPRRSAAISIHALREEGDHWTVGTTATTIKFLSTPSARRATDHVPTQDTETGISIHALREEGDPAVTSTTSCRGYFYPRPPRGGRPRARSPLCVISLFLSTPSARRATRPLSPTAVAERISIHALREEGDDATRRLAKAMRYFYPRPPRGGRLRRSDLRALCHRFLSTPSARRATRWQK